MRRLRIPLASRRLRWSGAVAVAAAIFYASVIVDPGGAGPGVLGRYGDKILHGVAYAVLALAIAYATAEWRAFPARRVLAVLAVAVGYGVLIEFVQATVPYRQFSVPDMAANAAGALLALAYVALERRVGYGLTDSGDGGSDRFSGREK